MSSCTLSTSTRVVGLTRITSVVAVNPLPSGRPRSKTITSGRHVAANVTASVTLPACLTDDFEVVLGVEDSSQTAADDGVIVAHRHPHDPGQGHLHTNGGAGTRP